MADGSRVLGTLVTALLAFAIGLVTSLFTAGVGLFSDGGGVSERYLVVAVGALLFFALGFAAGLLVPSRWRVAGVALGAGVIPVTVLFGEIGGRPDWLRWAALAASFVLSFLAAALLGSWLGARLRGRTSSRGPVSEPRV